MKSTSSLSALVFIVVLAVGLGIAFAVRGAVPGWPSYAVGAMALALAAVVSSSVQVANQWDRAVVLRMGRFQALRGPGLFFIVPVVDAIAYWIDTRVIIPTPVRQLSYDHPLLRRAKRSKNCFCDNITV